MTQPAVVDVVDIEPVKTKEQIAEEKRLAKEQEKQRKATNKIIKFYTDKQKNVYATGRITYGKVEHHKFNTLKDAEYDNLYNSEDVNGVIVEYTVSRIIRPIPTGKGKKKQYETIYISNPAV